MQGLRHKSRVFMRIKIYMNFKLILLTFMSIFLIAIVRLERKIEYMCMVVFTYLLSI